MESTPLTIWKMWSLRYIHVHQVFFTGASTVYVWPSTWSYSDCSHFRYLGKYVLQLKLKEKKKKKKKNSIYLTHFPWCISVMYLPWCISQAGPSISLAGSDRWLAVWRLQWPPQRPTLVCNQEDQHRTLQQQYGRKTCPLQAFRLIFHTFWLDMTWLHGLRRPSENGKKV